MSAQTQTVRNLLIIKRLTAFNYLSLFLKHRLCLFKWLMLLAASGVLTASFDVEKLHQRCSKDHLYSFKILWPHETCGNAREYHWKKTTCLLNPKTHFFLSSVSSSFLSVSFLITFQTRGLIQSSYKHLHVTHMAGGSSVWRRLSWEAEGYSSPGVVFW